jgi:N-acetylglucosamine malate deacetylase 1
LKKSERRNFLKQASLGLGSLTLASLVSNAASNHPEPDPIIKQPGKKLHIVCIGAHPGDPEFGCGGTMARYSDAGHSVTFIYLTRGEAGDPSKTYSESAALRTEEAESACKILNAKPVFAGQIDGNTILSREKNKEMAELIRSENPDLLFTQWPVDSHPDHQVAGMLALSAWVNSGRQFQLYFYEVNTGSETMFFRPTDYVDITLMRDRKKAAMFAHKTQDPINVYNEYFKTLEEFRGLEANVKAAEAFIHFKDKTDEARLAGLQ